MRLRTIVTRKLSGGQLAIINQCRLLLELMIIIYNAQGINW